VPPGGSERLGFWGDILFWLFFFESGTVVLPTVVLPTVVIRTVVIRTVVIRTVVIRTVVSSSFYIINVYVAKLGSTAGKF